MKHHIKLIAMLLSAIIAIQPIQSVAYALEPKSNQENDTSNYEIAPLPEPDEESEPIILVEEERRREQNSKTFRLSDGTFLTALYDEPIHYQDDNGAWQDIDNRLIPADQAVVDSGIPPEEYLELEDEGFQNEIEDEERVVDSGTPPQDYLEPEEDLEEIVEEIAADPDGEVENRAGRNKIKLSNKAKEGKTVTIKTDEYTIRWGLEGVEKARLEKVPVPEMLSDDPNEEFLRLQNLTNEVVYEEIYPDVDLQYFLTPTSVKENIILNSENAQRVFTEIYDIGKLEAVQIDERTIHLYNPDDVEQENPVFRILAPEMTDASGAFSGDVTIDLVEQKNKRIEIEIRPDSEWLDDEEREYPVALDPYIFTDQENDQIQDTFIAEDTPTTNYGSNGSMYIGNESSNYGVSRILLNFTLPPMERGDMVVSATLNMVQMPSGMSPSSGTMTIDAHAIKSSWTETGATWDDMSEEYDPEILDYYVATNASSNTYSTWDVTRLVKSWYNYAPDKNLGTPQYGILLKAHDETESVRTQYLASNNPNLGGYYPGLTIRFVNNVGLEGYWDYTTQSAGMIGTSYVNTYTGNLVFQTPVTVTTGSRAPASFVLTYNGYQSNLHFKNNQKGTITGAGWMNTFNQRIDTLSEENGTTDAEKEKFRRLAEAGYSFVYLDADGTEHYYKASDVAGIYHDEDGMGSKIVIQNSSTTERFLLEFDDGTKLTFTSAGFLYRIYGSDGNYIQAAYNGNNVSYFDDGAGRRTTLTVAGTTVTQVLGPDGLDHGLRYEGNVLDRINFPGLRVAYFHYDAQNRLVQVENPDGSGLTFDYYSSSSPMVSNRVEKVTEVGTNGSDGNSVSFIYNEDNSTKVTYHLGDGIEISETLTFDSYGRPISVIAADGSAAAYEYTSETETAAAVKKANKIKKVSSTSAPVSNMLRNHSAENNATNWTTSNWSSPGGTQSIDTSTAYLGQKSLKISQEQEDPTRSAYYQSFDLSWETGQAPPSYTASAYVKTEDVADGNGASIFVTFFDDTDAEISTHNSRGLYGTNDWKRISTTFTVPDNAASMRVYFGLSYANGDAWFDAMQLETGKTVNDYNLLENSDFSQDDDGWTGQNLDSVDGASEDGFTITGDEESNKNIFQVIPIHKPAEDVAFNVSGKAEGMSVPTDNASIYYCIDAVIYYTDGTNEPYLVEFNPDAATEQFASGTVKPSQAAINAGKTVDSIRFYILYYKNANSASFRDLQLYLDQSGTTYTYDDEGQVISADDNANRNQSYSYTDANEVSEATNAKNEDYTYTYDAAKPHRVTSARSEQTGMGFVYSYDSYGNVLNTKAGQVETDGTLDTSSEYIESSVTMNSAGNYVVSSTNHDGQTSNFNVSANSGLLNSQTDPEGNTTSFTYDPDTYQILTASGTGDAGISEVEYTYDTSDRLESIERNGMQYDFEYDEYGNILSTSIGTRTLSENTYGNGNGNLLSTEYGNGHVYGYGYDSLNRLESLSKNNTLQYQYFYDARGNIARLEDFSGQSMQSTSYTYDMLNRLTLEERSSGDYLEYGYDVMNRITSIGYFFDNALKNIQYSYDDDGRLGQTSFFGQWTTDHQYNGVNLLTGKETNISGTAGDPTLYTGIEYRTVSGNRISGLVGSYTNYSRLDGIDTELYEYSYTYDDNGNILSVTDLDGYKTEYEYDGLNQLVRVDDELADTSYTYEYDEGGNLTSVSEYAYTTGSLGTATDTREYVYGNADWTDLLTSYDGQQITYDEIGNPLSYRGMTLTWDGRKLGSAVNGTKNISYTYNENGIRTSKTVGESTTEYFLDGSTVVAQKTGDDVLWFLYDADGQRLGFTYNGTPYLYIYNGIGDVVGIVDDTLATVVEYTYSPWGEILSVDGGGANTIGTLNPFRYRGYYFEEETGLYYLNARYYDPEVGRFISADAFFDQGSLLGSNLFVYCRNNPVNFYDRSGYSATAVATGIAAAGAANFWNPVGWTILAIAAVVTTAAIIYYGVQTYQGYLNEKAAIIDKADQKIKDTVKRNSKVRYWTATVQKDYVDIGRSLTYSQAVKEVVAGRSVFTVTSYEAKAVALAAGGNVGANNKKLFPEIDKGRENTPGYYYHYHTYNRKGGHVYYLF